MNEPWLPPAFETTDSYVSALCQFIDKYKFLMNIHVVDFLTQDQWALIDPEWRQALLPDRDADNKSDNDSAWWDTLIHISTSADLTKDFIPAAHWPASFCRFIQEIRTLSLRRDRAAMAERLPTHVDIHRRIRPGMSVKKIHEVERMAPFVASVAKDACVQHVVDLGAGQGYLSRMLAFQHDLVVMAVDGSETQTCGAQRFDRMAARGFKEKAHQLHHVTDLLTPDTAADILASVQQHDHDAARPLSARNGDDDDDHGDQHKDRETTKGGELTKKTENENQWLICGLHACGDLSSMTLRLFTQRDEIKALVNVGCCYHFLTHPGDGDGDVGFPMSRLVHGYSLGSRACMLACQAPSRWLDQREATIISFQHHFYRFLLHWIMVQRGLWDVQVKAPTIGRLNKKRDFKSFPVYVRAALTRLGMDPDAISDVDAQTYHDTFKQTHQTDKRIALCWTIRALLGPAVESLILMDRYAYLDETLPATTTKKVWLCPLFDPVVSPRNMVVMATK